MSLSKITMLIGGQEELTTTQKEKRVGIVNVKDAVVQKILVRHRNLALAYNVRGLCVRWGFPALKPNSSNKL